MYDTNTTKDDSCRVEWGERLQLAQHKEIQLVVCAASMRCLSQKLMHRYPASSKAAATKQINPTTTHTAIRLITLSKGWLEAALHLSLQ